MTSESRESRVITSPLFNTRGGWPENEMRRFVIGHAADDLDTWVDEARQARHLDSSVGMAGGVLVSVDEDGAVQGSRLFVTGNTFWATGQTADNIWPDGQKEVSISFKFPHIQFPTHGDARNVSQWIDAAPWMSVMINDTNIQEEQWKDLPGVKEGLCVKFAIYPVSVDKYGVQAYYFPHSFPTLMAMADAKKVDLCGPSIPVGRLRFLRNEMRVIPALLVEPHPSKGFGQLPLIEVANVSNCRMPTRDSLEQEVCFLLRDCVSLYQPANNPKQLASIIGGAWRDYTVHPKPITWPKFPGPLESEPVGGECKFVIVSQSVNLSALAPCLTPAPLVSDHEGGQVQV